MILEDSGYRPTPVSDPVMRPSSGSTITTPLDLKRATFAIVAGLSHISVCIAGTRTSGAVDAITTFVRRSSARPAASRASRSAVVGAMTMASAFFASSI